MSVYFDKKIDPIKKGYRNTRQILEEIKHDSNNQLSRLPNEIFQIILDMLGDSLDSFGTHDLVSLYLKIDMLKKHDLIIRINDKIFLRCYEIMYIRYYRSSVEFTMLDFGRHMFVNIYNTYFNVFYKYDGSHLMNYPYNKIELFYRKRSLGSKIKEILYKIRDKLEMDYKKMIIIINDNNG